MDVRPIRSDQDLNWTLAEISRLWGAKPDTPDGDRLDVLATLADAYEAKIRPVPQSDAVDLLEFAISDMGRSQAELAELLGSRSRASEILARRRPLTLDQIRRVCAAWHLPASLMIRPAAARDTAA